MLVWMWCRPLCHALFGASGIQRGRTQRAGRTEWAARWAQHHFGSAAADSPAIMGASVMSSANTTLPGSGRQSGSTAISRLGRLSILRGEPGPVPRSRRRIHGLRVRLLELVIAQVRHRAATSVLAEHQAVAKLEGERPVRHLRRAAVV